MGRCGIYSLNHTANYSAIHTATLGATLCTHLPVTPAKAGVQFVPQKPGSAFPLVRFRHPKSTSSGRLRLTFGALSPE